MKALIDLILRYKILSAILALLVLAAAGFGIRETRHESVQAGADTVQPEPGQGHGKSY